MGNFFKGIIIHIPTSQKNIGDPTSADFTGV